MASRLSVLRTATITVVACLLITAIVVLFVQGVECSLPVVLPVGALAALMLKLVFDDLTVAGTNVVPPVSSPFPVSEEAYLAAVNITAEASRVLATRPLATVCFHVAGAATAFGDARLSASNCCSSAENVVAIVYPLVSGSLAVVLAIATTFRRMPAWDTLRCGIGSGALLAFILSCGLRLITPGTTRFPPGDATFGASMLSTTTAIIGVVLTSPNARHACSQWTFGQRAELELAPTPQDAGLSEELAQRLDRMAKLNVMLARARVDAAA